jgi:hypothetical protein
MEIEVGEYVRTIDGYIRKVEQVNRKGSYDGLCHGAYNVDIPYKYSQGISAKKIKSHSPNIIDLIEEGDYVNGEPVEKTETGLDWGREITTTTEYLTNNEDIQSIITKEQIKQIEYRI